MLKRDLLKKIGSLTISISLITLILFVLIPPATAVKLNPGAPDNTSVSKGTIITFDNVNLTIRSNERIPVEFLNFSIFNETSDQLVAHLCFSINSTIISQSPSGTFNVTNITNINTLPYGTGSSFGYDENDDTNHIFGYGYGYNGSEVTDINILYTITYETHIKGAFYTKLFVNSSTHTYASGKSSTFTVNDGWWNASWLHAKKITFDHTKITANLTNFPVLISSAIFLPSYVYAGGATTKKVYQYWNMTKNAETLPYGGTIYALAQDDTYVYAGGEPTTKVYQYWKSNMTKKAESTSTLNVIWSITDDDTYVYAGGDYNKIYQYWKSNMTKKAETANAGWAFYEVDNDDTYIYGGGTGNKVNQYWKSNMSYRTQTIDCGDFISALIVDDTYVYAGVENAIKKVYQFWKSNMTKKGETASYGGAIYALTEDDTYIYAGGFATNKVYQYWKSNMTKTPRATLTYGGSINALTQDGTYIYAGGATTNKVYQYWKSNMTKKTETATYGGIIYALCSDTYVELKAQIDGDDFVFVDSTNTTKYNHEIERWDPATGNLTAWVNITSLSNTTDTIIYLYYGNPTCTNQQNKYGTWDSNYLMVLHMNGASYTAITDSTSNKNNVTGYQGYHIGYQKTGKAGYAVQFLSPPYEGFLTFSSAVRNTLPITVEAWAKPTILENRGNYIISNGVEHGYKGFTMDFYGTSGIHDLVMNNANNSKQTFINSGTSSTETWYYYGMSWSGASADNGSFFVQTTKTSVVPTNYTTSPVNIPLCIGINAHHQNNPFAGFIDEIRISKVARSDGWLLTSYNTQNSPSTFMSFSAEMDNPAPTFTIQYYSDSGLTSSLGDNPKLKAGTYYIKITSNEALLGTPTLSIAAEGVANDVTNAATTSVAGNDYKYTRTISSDAATVGTVKEDISITGTDSASNTATNANPTDEASKAAYTDTTAPTLTITTVPTSPSKTKTALVYTFTFSEDVTGFTAADVTLNFAGVGAGLVDGSNFGTTSARVYTLTLAGQDLNDLGLLTTGQNVVASVAMTGLTDIATNAGVGTTANTWIYDSTAPTSDVTAITPYWKKSSPLMITVTATDVGSGLNNVTLYYYNSTNNATWKGPWKFGSTNSTPWITPIRWNFNFPNGTGYYRFYSVAYDNATNKEAFTVNDTKCGYDSNSPTATIGVPINGNYYKIMDTISGTCSDASGSGVNTVNITIYNVSANEYWAGSAWSASVHWFTTTLSGSPWSSWSYNSSAVTWKNASAYFINATATDNASNVGTAVHSTFYYDTYGPVISSISSGTPSTTSATITWITNENATGNVTYGTTTSYGSYSYYSANVTSHVVPLTGLSPGTTYHYKVISIDQAGNAANSTDHTFTINVAPSSSVTAITPYWKTSQPQIIGGTAYNGTSGLKNVTLWYRYRATNVSSWGGWVSSGLVDSDPWVSVSWSFSFSNGTGHYQFYSIAKDNATNVESKAQSAEASCGYDNVAPSSSVTAITPYWKMTSPLTLTVTASDGTGLSGLKNVTLYYYNSTNNATWKGPWKFGSTNSTPWITPIRWNFNFPNGTGYYRFYSVAYDNATNKEAFTVNDTKCGYDSNSPTATIGVPINGNYYKIMDTISGTCSDASGSGVNTVNITIYNVSANEYWAGSAWSASVHWFTTTLSGSPWSSWSYNSSAVTWKNASAYFINATATDNASNVGTAVHSTFYYDTYGPVISSISSGTPSTTSATITWITNENATGNVTYGTTTSYGSYSYYSANVTSHVVPLTGLSPGTTYHYKVISYDQAGNAANSTDHTFTTTSSGGGGNPPSNPTPVAEAGGPYSGYVNVMITFDGSRSTETGGAIAGYRWDWTNDGTYETSWSTSATAAHAYANAGSYTVKLQVKDNSNVTATDTATVTITIPPGTNASQDILDAILAEYGVSLTNPFYANDTNGDGVVDTFTDPNHKLTAVRFVNISDNASFLISTNEDNIPEFFWDTTTNTITPVHHDVGAIIDTVDNTDTKTITMTISVEKANWTYIEVTDLYPDNPDLIVKTVDGRTISSEMLWREGGKIFILDDPVTEYQVIYRYAEGSLFDVILELTPDSVHVGADISALITLINVGEPGLVNGTVNYTLYIGGEIVWSSEENVSVLSQKTFTKTISTDGLSPGSYTYKVIYSYAGGQTASAQSMFSITAPTSEEFPYLLWIILIILILIIIIVIIVILWKKNIIYIEGAGDEKDNKKEENKK
ncbi:MAG: DUF2341 domain-containing protein [Thermoplasmata archaeon]|nr:DUF2341 domain-containing protein [Thermoplasmata archaeon]